MDAPQPTLLADYRPFDFALDETRLEFTLDPAATRVRARLSLRRTGAKDAPLVLNGEGPRLLSIARDGKPLAPSDYRLEDGLLIVEGLPEAFTLETEVQIAPQANAALEGLYMSGGRFCTQCEAEGFRHITFFPDRPDVLSKFTVRIEAPEAYPRLLSNGNLLQDGDADGGRRWALWSDPFPKPCYLFALVAGELDLLEDSFTTGSGRQVTLRIYVDPGQAPRATWAMDSLKRAMRWDEERFGREYDLDLFMIVAVRDFNFGAMENKGLNIFNSSLVLADPATATDLDYERIEGVVAHEYFHNWTGNRITCRDWFQLCLKEGLTVFRDQSFSADQRGHAVRRIKEVMNLRARQFSEDAGPLAHPVRPTSYVKIDNFYTATIYEKGSELVRMLALILGEDEFRAGMDLYFQRCDGQATTIEAFIACFAEASGRDLSRFFRWYEAPGTPRLSIDGRYDPEARALDLSFAQERPGPPRVIPVAFGLLDEDGREQRPTELFVLEEDRASLRLEGVERPPVLSALRGFSAPVVLSTDQPEKDDYVLLAADPDLFNRWEAGQRLARGLILARAQGRADEVGEERFAEAMGRALSDQSADPAFKAVLLELPSESDLAVIAAPADPAVLHEAREALRARMAVHLFDELSRLHGGLQEAGEHSTSAEAAGRRALRNVALELLAADPHSLNRERARAHFQGAANMTDRIGGLMALLQLGGPDLERALAQFYEQWRGEPLVIDKWFQIQARDPSPQALGRVRALARHPDFEAKNPNRMRALVSAFATYNPARFHDPSGEGYRFLADHVLATDAFNPGMAARLLEPLAAWRRYRPELAGLMRQELARIADHPGLSKNVQEIAQRSLAAAAPGA